jgi:hypothetical protein
MIQIELFDSNGNSLQLGDVCIIHVPNVKIKYIGTLKFIKEHLQFVLHYKNNDWTPLIHSKTKYAKLELIGNISDMPKLQHFTGAHYFRTKTEAKNFMHALEKTIELHNNPVNTEPPTTDLAQGKLFAGLM